MACINTRRGPNFSCKEIEKLVKLVKIHWSIINNKGTDAATNASKIDAWKAIEKAFNQDKDCSIYRPHYVLRTKFDNLKRHRKKHPIAQKSNKGADQTYSSTDDGEEDCFNILQSVYAANKVKKVVNEDFDLNFTDSSYETVEFSEPERASSLRTTVTAFFQEPKQKYFLKEIDYEDMADGENDVECEWQRITTLETVTSEPQDSCITQSSEESLLKKRKCDENPPVSKGCNATEFNDLRKRAFLEKHNLTLQLLKEETEQRIKNESILHELRVEELRLRIQFMKEKHEAEMSLIKSSQTQDQEMSS